MTITYGVRLTVAGQGSVDIGDLLDSLQISSGSSDGWQQPDPASCQISFLGAPSLGTLAQSASWWLGRQLSIAVTPSDGSLVPVFYGRVFSVNSTPVDQNSDLLLIQLGLQSPMADLSQYIVTNNLPAQTETERLNALYDDARDVSWLEVGLNLAWDDIDPTITWAEYTSTMPGIGWDLATIHAMTAYTAENASIDNVFTEMAMGTGSFFGDRLFLNASNADQYQLYYTFADAYADSVDFTLDLETAVLFESIQSNMSLADIYNYVEATNGTDTRSFSAPGSIETYSLRKLLIDTPFSNVNDIDTLVANKAVGRSEPIQSLSSITVDYDLISDSKRIPYVGQKVIVNLTNVPASFGGDQVYIVRGMTLSVSYYHAEATWNVIPQQALAYFTTWYALNRTDTWNTYATALTKWSDLT